MSSELTPSDGKSPFGDPRGIAIPHEEYEKSLLLSRNEENEESLFLFLGE